MAINGSEQPESQKQNFGRNENGDNMELPAEMLKGAYNNNSPEQVSLGEDIGEFKNIVNQIMQDALGVWAQLWGELENSVPEEDRKLTVMTDKENSSCEWSDFIKKMWLLRHYLDFTKRLSQQEH